MRIRIDIDDGIFFTIIIFFLFNDGSLEYSFLLMRINIKTKIFR